MRMMKDLMKSGNPIAWFKSVCIYTYFLVIPKFYMFDQVIYILILIYIFL